MHRGILADDIRMDVMEVGAGYALSRIADEIAETLDRVVRDDPMGLTRVADLLVECPRVFVLGAGRSGLALRMCAMRLMHLGLAVHVVGDVTTPAIRSGDLLLVASGSGTTGGIVRSAEAAADAGARIAAITTNPSSPLAALAGTATIVVPAAGKLDRSGAASFQYAGSLFEQSVLLVDDALFHGLWRRSRQDADALWARHSNLE